MVIFVITKPNSTGESNEVKKAVNFFIFIAICVIALAILARFGKVAEYQFIWFSLTVKLFVSVYLPILYIQSVPNLKEYAIDYVSKNITHPITELKNGIYHFFAALKPTVRIYPTTE